MKTNRFVLLLGVVAICTGAFFSSCKKLNDPTSLGGDLIPEVDNINTFDTTIDVQAFSNIFGIADDSTRSLASDEHFLGKITNDPVFGTTDAQLFLELKPAGYPFAFRNIGGADSLHIDSVVLALDYVETYGDSTIPQTINVYELNNEFRYDSSYYLNRNNFTTTGPMLGSRVVLPYSLDDSIKVPYDTSRAQLRIRLDDAFGQRLLNYDSISPSGAYVNDSVFRTKFRGFAIKSESGGNALMGFTLTGANTKLAIYYRFQKGGTGVAHEDTTVDYFSFSSVSAAANFVQRSFSSQVTAAAAPGEDPLVYISNTPGTFATIKIPGLAGLSNRVVHRAELIMEQVYDPSDTLFRYPPALQLDAYDASISSYRTVPYDFTPDGTGSYNVSSFGALPTNILDNSGHVVKVWKFNISRYVQHVLTGSLPVYDFRVFAPYYTYSQYGIPPGTTVQQLFYVNPFGVLGRVRLGGGNHPTQRMRLHIVYSKI